MFRNASSISSPALLPMSHIIAPDAPLFSPPSVEASLAQETDSTSPYSYEPHAPYTYPAPEMASALKATGRASPDTSEPISCAPTHALFDLDAPIATSSLVSSAAVAVATPRADSPAPAMYSAPASPGALPSMSIAPSKRVDASTRSSSPSLSDSKKPRARITTRDFVPPDVSGLSKREARLVKNRAAAFLSRQRKREEFETMEIRVAELEQENARLRGGCSSSPEPSDVLLSEIEQLRAQLAAAEQRSSELNARLEQAATQPSLVKLEPLEEHEMPSAAPSPNASSPSGTTRSRSSSVSSQKPERSGAGIGLMVLMCALPSLLSSMGHSSTLSSQLSLASSSAPAPSSSYSGYHSLPYIPSDGFDFSSLMDIDGASSSPFADAFGLHDSQNAFDSASAFTSARASPAPSLGGSNTLGFVDGERLGLGNLDISFESAREDGKIRVRIHPPSSSSAAPSGTATPSWASSPPHDPFFGVGDNEPFSRAGSPFEAGFVGEGAARRRVRIALKSMPTSEGEGGEWEVELC